MKKSQKCPLSQGERTDLLAKHHAKRLKYGVWWLVQKGDKVMAYTEESLAATDAWATARSLDIEYKIALEADR